MEEIEAFNYQITNKTELESMVLIACYKLSLLNNPNI